MADISKCTGKDCLFKDKCYRYTAKSSMIQLYSKPEIKDGECLSFWDNEDKKDKE